MSKEQRYYEFLTRTDHPVFNRDFSLTTTINSPLNSIHNRIFAKSMVKAYDLVSEMYENCFVDTVTALTIDDWEYQYFGFTKPSTPLAQRVDELIIKRNKRFKMNVQDAIDLAISITGITPTIVRNANLSGWVLGQRVLGLSTIFGGSGVTGLYLVVFPVPIAQSLLDKLDERLTVIEKAGSRHKIKSPRLFWVLGRSSLGADTTLGE